MLQRVYARTLDIAAGPNALAALIVVSFVESSVFPIPPDILLIPMILARPRAAWSGPAVLILFSAWQATTHASQPVQRSRSITMAHL